MGRFQRTLVLPLAALAATACGDSLTGPGDVAALSHTISADELGRALDSAPGRVEIKLERGSLVAREVELRTPDEMSDEEYVRGQVTAVSLSGGTGTLTFEMGGLAATFGPTARFRDDAADGNLTMDEFVARIQASLAAGVEPAVRARRAPVAPPQAPDDPTFHATELRIRDRAESPQIELNVDADNFQRNDQPPPVAWLRVLGLTIEVRATTQLEADDDSRSTAEVEGIVASLDVAAGRVTLTSGAVILVTDASAFDDGRGVGDDEHLTSLAAVRAALDAGHTVKGEAKGAVQETNPLTIVAREVEFEVEGGAGADDGNGQQGQGVEFAAAVQSADAAGARFTLANGVTVRLTSETVISPLGDLFTLEAVAAARASGKLVRAEGRGVVEAAGPPATVVALNVKWEVDD